MKLGYRGEFRKRSENYSEKTEFEAVVFKYTCDTAVPRCIHTLVSVYTYASIRLRQHTIVSTPLRLGFANCLLPSLQSPSFAKAQ